MQSLSRSSQNIENTYAPLIGKQVALDLLSTLKNYSNLLSRYGLHVPVSSEKSLLKLAQIPDEQISEIRSFYELCSKWISPSAEHGNLVDLNTEKERMFAQYALDHYGLQVDESFWKTLERDHIIELYSSDMRQIYRSLNFFKYCGYSLLDISIHEWFVLYDRPKLVTEQMFKDVETVFTQGLVRMKTNVQKHVSKQIFNSGDTQPFIPRANIVDFQYLGVLKTAGSSGTLAGLACTCKVSPVADGDQALMIDFI
jgi:hypothetical protein